MTSGKPIIGVRSDNGKLLRMTKMIEEIVSMTNNDIEWFCHSTKYFS